MAVPTLSSAGWTAIDTPELHVGSGVLAGLGRAVADLGIRRPLVISDRTVAAAGWLDRTLASLGPAGLDPRSWLQASCDPDVALVERCREALLAGGHDGLIAIGGGSVIDLAKAAAGLAAHPGWLTDYEGLGGFTNAGMPVVAVATTPPSGAELSRHAVVADSSGRKFAVSGRWLAPRLVFVDCDALATLAVDVAIDSVLDSMLHAIEAYLARAATPYTDACARIAVGTLAAVAVPTIAGGDRSGAPAMVSGCLAAGLAMINANAGVVHALGYPLTSQHGLPHGRANALVAPAALRALAPAVPDRYAELGRLLTADESTDAAEAFLTWRTELGVSATLSGYGVSLTDLPQLAAAATAYQPVLRNARRTFTEAQLGNLYRSAWAESEIVP
jgi:alcohol dehydrogenase class IV